jgi:hypothetical protein
MTKQLLYAFICVPVILIRNDLKFDICYDVRLWTFYCKENALPLKQNTYGFVV